MVISDTVSQEAAFNIHENIQKLAPEFRKDKAELARELQDSVDELGKLLVDVSTQNQTVTGRSVLADRPDLQKRLAAEHARGQKIKELYERVIKFLRTIRPGA